MGIEKIIILPMKKETVHGVFLIEQECFSQPWSENAFYEELENPDAITLTAQTDKIVGFINARKIFDEVYINNIAVTKEYRRCHIAEKLLTELEKAVGDIDFITLEVRKSNIAAQRLYEKVGYEIVGERKNFYSYPTENAILMSKFFKRGN